MTVMNDEDASHNFLRFTRSRDGMGNAKPLNQRRIALRIGAPSPTSRQ